MEERHVIASFVAQHGQEKAVEALLMQFVGPARTEEGCLYYELLESVEQPGTFHILDGWRDEGCMQGHFSHPNVQRIVPQLTPLLSGEPTIRINKKLTTAA